MGGKKGRPKRTVKNKILIVTQGKRTEPNYFGGFKEDLKKPGIGLEIKSENNDALRLVDYTVRYLENKRKVYQSTWCVFDRDCDLGTDEDFDIAIKKAKDYQIEPIFSIQCFELWLLLHYKEFKLSCNSCSEIISALEKELSGETYKKNDKKIYKKLLDKQKTAIKNAKSLEKEQCHKYPFHKRNPYTNVHILVKELNSKSN